MAQDDFERRLTGAARALGLAMKPGQAQTLLTYMQQMQRWNRTYNLTAVRDAGQMLVQHVFDSLAIIQPLRLALGDATVSSGRHIVDVGSGGGLPGVVIAAMEPQWQVRCVDAVEKKMAFVRQMTGVLNLPNLHAVHARIESLPPLDADIVISRAFASLDDFAALAGRHVSQNGRLLAMKGREPTEEIAALQQNIGWFVERIEPLTVPELDAQRCLVWMSRQGNP